jgi:tetratricopeptide (TPR) repeat protein
MEAERAKVEIAAKMLEPLAEHLDITLDVKDWRAAVPDMGIAEKVILDQLKPTKWDVFIGMLWHRFGTPTGDTDPQTQRAYWSGVEQEFKDAYRLWKEHGTPRIMMYRCTRAVPLDDIDPEQYQRVKEFFAQFDPIKGAHPGLFQTFDTAEAFERLLLDNLQRLLIAYSEKTSGKPVAPEVVQEFAPKLPDNLPRRSSFFGRDKEMATVMRALSPEDRTWGILVDGIGGIGKTALAVEAAYRCKEQASFDAFIYVSAKLDRLEPGGIRDLTATAARTLDEFLNETARVLGRTEIPQLAGEEKRRALLDALREKRALLIYDNLETLTKEEQESVAAFLRELPLLCKAIITSRRRGGEGGNTLRLEKLEWDAARQIIEAEAQKDKSLNDKLQLAGEAHWRELHDETKGSPLALTYVLGLMRVRATLTFDGALEMLRGNRTPDLQKFIFQQARKELTANDEAALRALSFFVPSATFEAWTEVSGLSRTALEMTIDRLSALSLVDVLVGEERYALHSLTRNFVRSELLADAQIAHQVGMHFAEHWIGYAQRYGGWEGNYKTFNLIEAEWLNIDAAAGWLWQTTMAQDKVAGNKEAARMLGNMAMALCVGSSPLFNLGRWEERLKLSARAYEAMRALDDWSSAGRFAYATAWLHYNRADTDKAAKWTDRCVEAWARGGRQYEQATGLLMRGQVLRQRKNYDDAELLLQNALAIWRGLKSDRDVALALNSLGALEHQRKQFNVAEEYYRESLKLCEKIAWKEGIGATCVNLGLLAVKREDWAEAREWLEKALSLARELGRQASIASAQYGLACVHEGEAQFELALPLAQEVLANFQKLHHQSLPGARELVERLKKKIGEQSSPPAQ